MQLEVGAVLEGKITGITKFGAFVSLPEGKSGLVHISEIADTYVSNVSDFVKAGDAVKVKVIGINEGKINLSMKKALEPEKKQQHYEDRAQNKSRAVPADEAQNGAGTDKNFEDKLKKFMQESDSRIAGNPMYADRGKSRRRR